MSNRAGNRGDFSMNTRSIVALCLILQLSYSITLVAPASAHGDGSILFNGTTSKLENDAANILDGSNEITVCVWVKANTFTGSSQRLVFCLSEDAGQLHLNHQTSADTMGWSALLTGSATWTFPVKDGAWQAISVVYDRSLSTNDPIVRVNFADVTESNASPAGSPGAVPDGYCVGNDSTQSFGWDGQIAHLQVFNRILQPDEQDACLRKPGSVTNGLRLWLPMTHATDIDDRSVNRFHGTATALATGANGPAIFTHPIGAPSGVVFLTPGILPVTQFVIPREGDGANHPAGELRGAGIASAIQGTLYGPTDGTNPQEIVVTEDWTTQLMRQWDNGPATQGTPPNQITLAEAVLQPVVRDVSILGKVDLAGYADSLGGPSDIINSNTPGQWNPRFPHGHGIDFNGTTSKLQNTGADVLNNQKKVTVCVWINPDARRENNLGYVFVLDEDDGTSAFYISHGLSDDLLYINKSPGGAGTAGLWQIPIKDGVWNAVCVRLDFSGDNPPTARVNFRPVAVTQLTGPVGIQDQPPTGYCVGNRNPADRTWDGRIAHLQVFNDILTDAEADVALNDPGSFTTNQRLHLPMDGETDTEDLTSNNFDGTPTDLDTIENFHDRETGLALRASGPLVENVGFFHIAGTACMNIRDSNVLAGPIQPFDREMATLRDLSVYRSYSGFLIGTIDTEVGNLEGEFLRDWGIKVPDGVGGVKFEGAVHMSGVKHEEVAPAAYGTAVWFEDNAGTCWGSGPWYCETSDVAMRIGSSGNKITNFFSKDCVFRNLWFENTSQRNSVTNFEIDVLDGVTEVRGCEAILIAGQSNMLSKGTIGGDHAVPAGEIAIRITNGTRQTIRDVDIVGTFGSSAPLISVESQLNNSVIVAKCVGAGTFLDLHPIMATGTARGGTTSTIQFAASQSFPDDSLNGMTVYIIGGTGSTPVQARTITDFVRSSGTATVSPAWTTAPSTDSVYEVRLNGIGPGNYIRVTTTTGNVTKRVNLPPSWDEANWIGVDGLKLRGSITNVSSANPAVITSPNHGLADGDKVAIQDVVGETGVNSGAGTTHTVDVTNADTFTVPVDTTGGSSYTVGTGWWGDWEAK
jgi:hypothetical protein